MFSPNFASKRFILSIQSLRVSKNLENLLKLHGVYSEFFLNLNPDLHAVLVAEKQGIRH